MTKKRGLGKGLGALISAPPAASNSQEETTDSSYCMLDLDKIKPNPHQPRKTMSEDKMEELIKSIQTHGLIQPIVVRYQGDKESYEIIVGERRWRACQKLKLKQVPVLIKEYTDIEAAAASLIENIQREDLNAVDEAAAYQTLMRSYGLTQEDLSARIGKSRPFIANMVRLLRLPEEVKEMLAKGIISVGHARALVAIKDSETQIKFTLKIIQGNLSVRKTEEMIKKYIENLISQKAAMPQPDNTAEAVDWSQELARIIGRRVQIKNNKKGGGRLIITYDNPEDLENLIQKLKKD